MKLDRLLKLEDVAEILSVNKRTVFRLIAQGKLVLAKVGRSSRIPESSLAEYIERAKQECAS